MKIKLFGTVCVLSALTMIACGDDEGSGGSDGTTSGNTTSNATGGTTKATTGGMTTNTTGGTTTGGMACELPDTAAPMDCAEACSDLYDCGALTCNGAKNCAGFSGDAMEKTAFIGDAMNGCIAGCMANMALITVVDPENCDSTVDTISQINMDFAEVCMNGFGQ